jgi:hypothetical protein
MSVSYNTSAVTNGLVLCVDAANTKSYPGTGTAWNDLSGNLNNASLNAPSFNAQGYFSWDGNAVTSVGSIANATSINFSEASPYSVELMAYPNTNQPGGSDAANVGEAVMLEKWNYSGTGGYPFAIRLTSLAFSPPSWFAAAYNGTLNPALTTSAVRDQWSHLVAVYDWPNNILRFYVNGVQRVTTTLTVGAGGFSSPTSPLYLGQRAGGSTNRFAGRIGTIRLYNRALSAAEVLQNFNALRGRYGI